MSFIERELHQIERALREPQSDARYCQLYAAQQALAWALEPVGFAAPFATINAGKVTPLTGTQEDSGDYLAHPHRLPSLCTYSQTG